MGAIDNWANKRLPAASRKALKAIRKREDLSVFNPEAFSWIPQVEAQWKTIRAEWLELRKTLTQIPTFHEVSSAQKNISKKDQWRTFVLYAYGHRIQKNCAACPETERALKQIPGMTTAMFSYLKPGTRIPEHTGPYNGYLRYQLALQVPEAREKCWIRINGAQFSWEEGKSLVFDDTYPHEVHNDTHSERVILFVDFLRPLPFPLSLRNRWVHFLMGRSDRVKEAVKNASVY